MVLCELGTNHGFVALWLAMSLLGLLSMLVLSSALFYPYYAYPTFERWQLKTNEKFPSPSVVKKEIIHMCKGLSVATLCPAFSLMASRWGYSKGYCGSREDASSLLIQALTIFFFTDFYEYAYHWLGHSLSSLWVIHKHHHVYFNPSPFSVIADEWADQLVRTLPMIFLPLMMPINMDLLFLIFATLFYGYGVYLHWGYESKLLTAHNPILNTAYHHYMHHAKSVKGNALYTGFFFKLWDNLFGTNHNGKCICFLCRPPRTVQQWEAIEKPDYSVLLSINWWISGSTKAD